MIFARKWRLQLQCERNPIFLSVLGPVLVQSVIANCSNVRARIGIATIDDDYSRGANWTILVSS
jgi:hypothetical protein